MNNRRQFIVKCCMAAGAVTVLKPLHVLGSMQLNQSQVAEKLLIIHTSNLMGQWHGLTAGNKYVGLGGLENLKKAITNIRKQHTNVLLLSTGDMINKNAQVKEQLEFYQAVSTIKFDAVTPGRNDLANGIDLFTEMANNTGLMVIDKGTKMESYTELLPYKIVNVNNLQVALIDCSEFAIERMRIKNKLDSLNKTAASIKSKVECALTICMVQGSWQNVNELACNSLNVDVLLTDLPNYSVYNTRLYRNKKNHEVVVSATGTHGTMFNQLKISYDNKSFKREIDSKLLLTGVEDEKYQASLLKYQLFNV